MRRLLLRNTPRTVAVSSAPPKERASSFFPSRRTAAPFALTLLFLAVTPLVLAEEKPEHAAQKPAEDWLAIVDAGDYGGSWENAASFFKTQVTKEQWTAALKQVRDKLGKTKTRTLKNATYTETVPGAPPGKYVVFDYSATYDSGTFAETVVTSLEKDTWKVSGYFVKASQ